MSKYKSILCPVDLSNTSQSTVDLATGIALHHNAKLVFLYVAPQWLPEEAMFGSEYIRETVAEDKREFLKIRPSNESAKFDHLFVYGNPGPEIVSASREHDLIVMNTHGRGGMLRLLMGSVAQYVLRNADCPVISYKSASHDSSKAVPMKQKAKPFVTDLMHQVAPIHRFDEMNSVIVELQNANETGAPVVDEMGCCQGILTQSDIEKYLDLKQRLQNRDESVVDEIFETDEFGQRRTGSSDFDQVHRHMTSPVVTIANTQSCQAAAEVFDSNQEIHHLVVVDDKNHPVGILGAKELAQHDDEITSDS